MCIDSTRVVKSIAHYHILAFRRSVAIDVAGGGEIAGILHESTSPIRMFLKLAKRVGDQLRSYRQSGAAL